MNWFWIVRIYDRSGDYWHGQIKTGRDLQEIGTIKDFYESLTGCKMILEGMKDTAYSGICDIGISFAGLWK